MLQSDMKDGKNKIKILELKVTVTEMKIHQIGLIVGQTLQKKLLVNFNIQQQKVYKMKKRWRILKENKDNTTRSTGR